jgi:uncharacterized protein
MNNGVSRRRDTWKRLILMLILLISISPGESNALGAELSESEQELLDAAMDGNVMLINEMLEAGAKVNVADENGITPLMQAAAGSHVEAVAILLKAKADVNAKTSDGTPALTIAVEQCGQVTGDNEAQEPYWAVMRMLVKAGADVHAKDNDGWAAMAFAKSADDKGTIRILTELGTTQ